MAQRFIRNRNILALLSSLIEKKTPEPDGQIPALNWRRTRHQRLSANARNDTGGKRQASRLTLSHAADKSLSLNQPPGGEAATRIPVRQRSVQVPLCTEYVAHGFHCDRGTTRLYMQTVQIELTAG